MSVRLLALDLDGTLLDSSWKLSRTNISALRHAHRSGVQIVVATGRRYTFTQPITAIFNFPHYLITNAGAVTRNSAGDRLFRHTLNLRAVQELLQFSQPYRPWTFLIFDHEGPGELICETPHVMNPNIARYLKLNERYLTTVEDLEVAVEGQLVQIALMGSIDEMRSAAQLIESCPSRGQFNVLRTEYPARDFALLDVIDRHINKGRALAELSGGLNIPREEIMAIGDNHNDLDMLTFAGLPIVMKNAPGELKVFGWPVTGTNDEDGVAQAVEQFILSA